jgi:hypothetical protein
MEQRLHSKVGIAIIIVGSIFLLTAGAALAASAAKPEPAELTASDASPNMATSAATGPMISPTTPMTGGVMIPTCISLFFTVDVTHTVDVTDVVALRSDGLGWGGIAKAYFLAQLSDGWDVEAIVALKVGGMGWGEIARDELELPPGNHGQNLGLIVSGRGAISSTVPMGAQRLADRLGTTPGKIVALLDQGATYGTIVVAHKLADRYGGDPQGLVDQRLVEGLSWGEIRRTLRTGMTATTSAAPTASGNPHDQGNHGNQDHGNPHNEGNQGRGQEQGRGHDKDHGGGKKH